MVSAIGGESMMISDAQSGNANDNHLNGNGLDQLVADAKPDDADYVEYVDEEERDYQELISNKSGNFAHSVGDGVETIFMNVLLQSRMQPKECILEPHANKNARRLCTMYSVMRPLACAHARKNIPWSLA